MDTVKNILAKQELSKEDLVVLLNAGPEDTALIFQKAAEIKATYIGNRVHLRGLIELSNICAKNCLYCGIRHENKSVERYSLSDADVETAFQFAIQNKLGSVVIQSGELSSPAFIEKVESYLRKAKEMSDGKLGITLSCGEQTEETYLRWKAAGAHRYLLRIEASNRELYNRIHPNNLLHDYDRRLTALTSLKNCGYQTGTGVMIGLPFQTIEDLADDLLFMRDFDIDMCGMGPYVEHEQTPLSKYNSMLKPVQERLTLTLKMIALLRIIMKDINIASTTALQALADEGREQALSVGANIVMPNITPGIYRNKYALYCNKPGINEEAEDSQKNLELLAKSAGCEVVYSAWGDSKHFVYSKV